MLDTSATEAECRAYLEALRWPKGVVCPRCAGKIISRIKARKAFDCDGCRYQFSVTAGTLFHDSHLPLRKWFVTIFLICESNKGMTANRLKRMLKVSYKTAWYLCHRIRAAMVEVNPEPLTDTVEVDEAHVGRGHIGIGDTNTKHGINHRLMEYLRGDVHSSTVDSMFKRSLIGSLHQVSTKHLDRYLNEFEYRFNNRKNPYLFRDILLKLIDAKALPYEQLTA